MKEFNFANLDLESDDYLIFKNNNYYDEDLKFDSSSIIVNEIEVSGNVKANYSLICIDDIRGKDITIEGDFICFGDITCNKLIISGELKCYGEIDVNEVSINNNAFITEGLIRSGNIDEDLICINSLEVSEKLKVKNYILCLEGILGDGQVECKDIWAKDYIEVTLKSENKVDSNNEKVNKVVKAESKSKERFSFDSECINYMSIKEKLINHINTWIKEMQYEDELKDLSDKLKRMSDIDEKFLADSEVIKLIDQLQDYDCIDELYFYLQCIDKMSFASDSIKDLDIYKYVNDTYLPKQKNNLYEMSVSSITNHKEFVNALYLIEKNKEYFDDNEVSIILDKIYSRIGVKRKLVLKAMEN